LFSQTNEGKVWTEIGVNGKIIKDLDWATELTTRFGVNGLETVFPSISIKYKVKKWFKPSVEYRYIVDRENFDTYSNSHRLNFNADFKRSFDRLTIKSRIRYQYSFDRLLDSELYSPEFDQAIRLKIGGTYDINNSFLSPVISGELFYNPMYGPYGQQLTKFRLFAGVDIEMDGPHEISVGYIFDNRINLSRPLTKHILSLGYSYKIGGSKK
jgi:predicted porin